MPRKKHSDKKIADALRDANIGDAKVSEVLDTLNGRAEKSLTTTRAVGTGAPAGLTPSFTL